MRFLKLYENFSDIENDIKSIFYDLEDSGFTIDILNLEKVGQYLIGIKKLGGSISFPQVSPFEVDNDIIDCILRLKKFAPYEGFEVDHVSINHPFHKQQSKDVNITDEGFFVKSVYGAPFQPDEVKVDYPIIWISIKLKKI
jgi:hypothetical protein